MSAAVSHDSSAMMGSRLRRRRSRSPSRSSAGSGCSTNATPYSSSMATLRTASFTVHAVFAST